MTIFDFKQTKAGMTLVEMIISLVVLSILMTSTMGIVMSSSNLFISTSMSALDKQVGNHVVDLLTKVLRYSTHLTIRDVDDIPAPTSSQQLYLTITDEETNSGIIKYKSATANAATNLYSDSFYGIGHNKRTVNYTIEETGSTHQHLKITVTVYRENKLVYKRSEIVKCINLALITSGSDKNLIVDKSTKGSSNQCLVFSVDEQLISGGSDAYSLEYKISEYIAKYNTIQKLYASDLNKALGLINDSWNAESPKTPGLKGTQNATGNRIGMDLYTTRIQQYYSIVFGDSDDKYVYNESDITKCKNLRAYYQKQIKDLLTFMPTAAGYVEGTKRDNAIPADNDASKTISFITHTGDPYYGVVATKEELYAGFMLLNYDKDGKNGVTKDEFPSFTDPDTFFAGTSIASYISQTSNSEKNKMVTLAYCVDNVVDDDDDTTNNEYKPQLQITSNETVYATDGTQSTMVASTLSENVSEGYHTVDNEGVKYISKDNVAVDSSKFINFYENYDGVQRPFFNEDANGTDLSITLDTGTTYKYKVKYATVVGHFESRDWISDYDDIHDDYNYANSGYTAHSAKTTFESKLSATDLSNKTTWSPANKGGRLTNSTLTATATSDLAEGWYKISFKDSDNRENWIYFKLTGSSVLVDVSQTGIITETSIKNEVATKIAVKKGDSIKLNFDGKGKCTGITYSQAQYHKGDSGATYTLPTGFTTFYAHQFVDYALYGVDWNSWFSSTRTGIINKILSGGVELIQRLFGREYSTDITAITGDNAVKSLGNAGLYSVNGFSTSTSSYNMAFCVYVPSTGTWYYLPKASTRLSSSVSKISFTSSKDQPTPIDVELQNGSTWYNSTAMSYDIKNRKLTASGLFGLVDTTKDQNWVSLPTGNQAEVKIETDTSED